MKSAAPRFGALLVCLLLLTLSGCGKKGPVQPLVPKLPKAPGAFAARQMGQRALLSWTLPTQNQDGSAMTNLQGFRIFKMRYELSNECAECRDTSLLLKTIDLDFLKEARREGNRLFYWDDQLEVGFGYRYRVVGFNSENRDGESSRVVLPFVVPPPAPAALEAQSHDRMVRLSWRPSPDTRPEAVPLGYNIYRHPVGAALIPQPVNPKPLTEPTYDDFEVVNDRACAYVVTAVARIGDTQVESALSSRVEVTPKAGN